MEEKSKQTNRGYKKHTLCWLCKNAVPNHLGDGRYKKGVEKIGCDWSIYGKPVKGWEAIETQIKGWYSAENATSFRVVSCPEFIKG